MAIKRAALEPAAPNWRRALPATATPRDHPWDIAHDFASQPPTAAAPPVQFVEPDFLQEFIYEPPPEPRAMFPFGEARSCEVGIPNANWPTRPEFAWHLRDEFSQLASARVLVGQPAGNRVRVGILDTGFDPNHSTLPLRLLTELPDATLGACGQLCIRGGCGDLRSGGEQY